MNGVADEVARVGLENLEKALDDFKVEARGMFEGLRAELAEFRRGYAGRPTWPVTALVAVLGAACASLLALVVR